jgi:hypothetical protein
VVSVGCALLEDFEDHFIDDVIVADIGEGTDGWEFSGSSYSVVLRQHTRWEAAYEHQP